MADLARIKRNVAKMAAMNAPEQDIDGYIASEGVTVDDVRDYGKSDFGAKVALLDKGASFGFGRKTGGLINAIGAYPVDRIAEAFGVKNTPTFSDRYHEITDEAVKQAEDYAQRHPVKAAGYELAGSVVNPLNKVGLGYIKGANTIGGKVIRAGVVGSGTGALSGAGRSESIDELPENVTTDALVGGVIGGSLPVAEKGIGKLWQKGREFFDPVYAIKDKATGLGNIAKDNNSMRVAKRGIQSSDDVANQIAEQAPTELGKLNSEMQNILNETTGRKIDIKQANINAKNRYADFINQNADKEIMDFMPRDPIKDSAWYRNIVPDNKPVEMTDINIVPEKADVKYLKNFIKDNLGTENTQATQTGEEVLFSNGSLGRIIKKNRNSDDNLAYSKLKEVVAKGNFSGTRPTDLRHKDMTLGQNIYHSGIVYNKKPYSVKFYVDQPLPQYPNGHHVYAGQDITPITKTKQAASDVVLGSRDAASTATQPVYAYNMADLRGNVNSKMPNISSWYENLTPTQTDMLDTAIATGLGNTNKKAGTLESVAKIKEALNQMIKDSKAPNPMNRMTSIDTPDTVSLNEIKQRVDRTLGKMTKSVDANYSKAKRLTDVYEMGYNFKPSEEKFENLGLSRMRDKQAFLQGRLAKILDNVKDDKNLSKAIRQDENTLKKLMPENKFNELIHQTNRIDTEYERVKSLADLARRKLVKPEAAERPASEKWESLGAFVGSQKDEALAKLFQKMNTKQAQYLLNGNIEPSPLGNLLQKYGSKIKPSDYTAYLVEALSQNQ